MTTAAMLEQLIAFPTVSNRSNLDLAAFISAYLAEHGVPAHLVHDATGQKVNLFATIGPNVAGGVILSGHMDVVPEGTGAWVSDPFCLSVRDGRLYGRGTCDMKGFVAAVLAAVPRFCAANLKAPVHIALSYDEEVGCLGVPSLVEAMAGAIASPRAVIVGEPTGMGIVAGHKGSTSFHTIVHGHTGHSSRIDQGVSAVMVAARLVTWLEDRMEMNASEADPGNWFLPPYTTLHCGTINGGTAANVIAETCQFVTDIRAIPGDDPLAHKEDYLSYIRDVIEPRMQRIALQSRVEVVDRGHVHGLSPEAGKPARDLARDILAPMLGKVPVGFVSYGTEAGFFAAKGWPTIVCGPGDIAQAHRQDEFIEQTQLDLCDTFLAGIALRLSA